MGPFLMAWLIGEGIIGWRWAKAGAPPTPGALLLPSGLFLGLAILAQYAPARATATAFAYAVDLAVLVQVAGKAPVKQKTGWPPPLITDPMVLLPGSGASSGTANNPANTPAAVGGANAQNNAPPGTPANPGTPPTGAGTIYPPGSQSL